VPTCSTGSPRPRSCRPSSCSAPGPTIARGSSTPLLLGDAAGGPQTASDGALHVAWLPLSPGSVATVDVSWSPWSLRTVAIAGMMTVLYDTGLGPLKIAVFDRLLLSSPQWALLAERIQLLAGEGRRELAGVVLKELRRRRRHLAASITSLLAAGVAEPGAPAGVLARTVLARYAPPDVRIRNVPDSLWLTYRSPSERA
jgi:hypothetical protein